MGRPTSASEGRVGERQRSASIAVRPELQDSYNAELQERSRSAVWLTGCRNWCLDASGNNRALWPGSTVAFRRRTKHLRQDE
jgi:hypothetical protein